MERGISRGGADTPFVCRAGCSLAALRGRIADALARAGAAETPRDDRARIATAMACMERSGGSLRATEARLAFEGARLKRSAREIRKSQEDMQRTQATLALRAERAREVAETAGRTVALIEDIQAAMARGEPVEHLLQAGETLIAAGRAERRQGD